MSSSTGRHNVAKGPRACTTCARAKSRCIPGPSPDKCERCHRLNKLCGTQTPAPPRKRKEPKRTKVQELEQRLEDLTARLESTTGKSPIISQPKDRNPPIPDPIPPPRPTTGFKWNPQPFMMSHLFPGGVVTNPLPTPPDKNPDGYVPPPDTPDSASGAAGSEALSDNNTPEESTPDTGHQNSPPSQLMLPAMPVGKTLKHLPTWPEGGKSGRSLWPQGAEAEEYLANYRKHAADLLPFVVIPEYMSSAQLLMERPYLWKGVMMHACHVDGQRQLAAGTALVQELVTASFCQAIKSLDMLQGLIVMIAWFHYNLNSTQLTNMFFLARGMVATLSLCEKIAQLRQRPPPELTAMDIEETRTLAGVYYLLTMVFNANKKPDSLMDPIHVENCCAILESRLDAPGDLLAINLCGIQMLSHTITTTVSDITRQSHQLPFHILLESFRQRINSFRAELPLTIADNPALNCHIHMAEILLYEPAVKENPAAVGNQQQHHFFLTPSDRIPILWQLLQATKGFLRVRMANPMLEQPRFTCATGFDFMYAFLVCVRLVLLGGVPGWDVITVKQELDLEPLIDKQIREMEMITQHRLAGVGMNSSDDWEQKLSTEMKQRDPFHRLGVKLRQLKFLFHFDRPQPEPQAHPTPPPAPAVQLRSPDLSPTREVNPAISGFDVDMGVGLTFDGAGSMDLPPLDGFDPEYWHDVFSENAMRFYSGHMHTHDTPYYNASVSNNDMEPPSLELGSIENRWPV